MLWISWLKKDLGLGFTILRYSSTYYYAKSPGYMVSAWLINTISSTTLNIATSEQFPLPDILLIRHMLDYKWILKQLYVLLFFMFSYCLLQSPFLGENKHFLCWVLADISCWSGIKDINLKLYNQALFFHDNTEYAYFFVFNISMVWQFSKQGGLVIGIIPSMACL